MDLGGCLIRAALIHASRPLFPPSWFSPETSKISRADDDDDDDDKAASSAPAVAAPTNFNIFAVKVYIYTRYTRLSCFKHGGWGFPGDDECAIVQDQTHVHVHHPLVRSTA